MSSEEKETMVAPLLIEAENVTHQGKPGIQMQVTEAYAGVMVSGFIPYGDDNGEEGVSIFLGICGEMTTLLERTITVEIDDE